MAQSVKRQAQVMILSWWDRASGSTLSCRLLVPLPLLPLNPLSLLALSLKKKSVKLSFFNLHIHVCAVSPLECTLFEPRDLLALFTAVTVLGMQQVLSNVF